jgi:O-Antigen ligase
MIRDILLVNGILFSSATQLRIPGWPLGPGEAMLALWLALTLSRNMARLNTPFPAAALRLSIFWVWLTTALCIGAMAAYVLDIHTDPNEVYHDIFAYLLVALLSLCWVAEPHAETRMRKVYWLLATGGSILLGLQLAEGTKLINLTGLYGWEWDRFRGWAENSNTMALLCLLLAGISVHLIGNSKAISAKILAGVCVILSVTCGLMSDSDGFKAAIAISSGAFFVFKLIQHLRARSRKLRTHSLLKLTSGLIMPLFLAFAAPVFWISTHGTEPKNALPSLGHGGELGKDANERLELWQQALTKVSRTGFLGQGPGPHLERLPQLRERPKTISMDLAPPPPSFEAHNTFVDLLGQGGVLVVLGLIWFGANCFLLTFRAGHFVLSGLVLGLAAFGATHFILRNPVTWIFLSYCLLCTKSGSDTLMKSPVIREIPA